MPRILPEAMINRAWHLHPCRPPPHLPSAYIGHLACGIVYSPYDGSVADVACWESFWITEAGGGGGYR